MAEQTVAVNATADSTLPGPVSTPEYYTGFGKEFEQIGVELQSAYERMQKAESELTKAPQSLPTWASVLALFSPPANLANVIKTIEAATASPERIASLKAEASAEFDDSVKAFQLAEWKVEVMQTLPAYMSDPIYTIESVEDILKYIAPGIDLTDADTAWLGQVFEKLKPLTNILPEDYQGDILETQTNILNNILSEPKLEMKGVHRLTVDEIAKAFTFQAAELPEGMTEEDVRTILSKIDLQDEELQTQRDWLAERAKEWELESARMNMIRAGEILAETPELTPLQWAKLTVTQPMMATVELMQKWWDTISRPISAAIMIQTPAPVSGALHGVALGAAAGATIGSIVPVIGTAIGAGIGAIVGAIGGAAWFSTWEDEASKELAKIHEFYISQGDSSWSAYAKAFNEWEAPWYQKMILDSAYDPLMWVGWGGVSAVGSKITNLAKPLSSGFLKKAGTRIGAMMVAFENGYTAGMDAIFKAGMEVVAAPIKGAFWLTGAGYAIPKSFMQMSRNFGRKGMMELLAVAQQRFPTAHLVRGKLVGITTQDFSKILEECTTYALKNPTSNDLMAKAGTAVMEFTYQDADNVMSKFLQGIADDATLDTPALAKLNSDLLDAFSGYIDIPGVAVTHGDRIAAANILNRLNKLANLSSDEATKLVDTLASRIGRFKESVANSVVDSVKDMNPGDAIYSIFNRMVESRYSNLKSPLTEFMQQAGRSSSWHQRVADRILQSSRMVWLERKVVMPIAKQQLLFTNFGPYNYLENSMRSFLGGAEALVPKSYGGVDEFLEVGGKLVGCPYELIMLQRGEKRLIQAMVNPETGRALVFKGGNIPFVTRNVVVSEKIPFFGGKQIGHTITIGNERYFLGSFQDWYDMWSDLVGKQMAYDYQVHFTKALYDTPLGKQTIDGINSAMERNRYILQRVSSIKSHISDTERLVRWKGLNGPEDIRKMADVDVPTYQRRYIGMQYNQKADQMPDIDRITRETGYDSILDGSMFYKGKDSIDETFSRMLAGARDREIASLGPQITAMREQVEFMLANPPKNLDDFLWDMNTLAGDIEAVRATIHNYRSTTRIRSAQMLVSEADDFEAGSAKYLARYMNNMSEDLTRIMNRVMENARLGPNTTTGFRVGGAKVTTGAYATEGTGLYVARNELTAKRFIEKNVPGRESYKQINYLIPSNPLVVNDELLPSLMESDIVFQAIRPDDSVWIRLNKQAARNIGLSKSDWYLSSKNYMKSHKQFNDELANLVRAEGYDGISVRISNAYEYDPLMRGFEWDVLMDYSLWKDIKPGAILSDIQLSCLTDLDKISRLELKNIIDTRTKLATIESEIPAFHKANRALRKTNPDKADSRSHEFWASQKARKADIWDEYDSVADQLKAARLGANRNFLMSVDKPVFVPDFVPEVTDKLTANHLAYLYGATGDDLYRGLTEVFHNTTVRPRTDFIIHTKEQASAYAAKFNKTAEQLGFTDEAIGEVYDQMLRSLGINPNILTPDASLVMELKELRQEMYLWYAAGKIPEDDVMKLRQYFNSVADEVGGLDAYREAIVGLSRAGGFSRETLDTIDELTSLAAKRPVEGAKDIDEALSLWIKQGKDLGKLLKLTSESSDYLPRLHTILKAQYGDDIVVYRGISGADVGSSKRVGKRVVSVTTDRKVAAKFGDVEQFTVKVSDILAAGPTLESELLVRQTSLRAVVTPTKPGVAEVSIPEGFHIEEFSKPGGLSSLELRGLSGEVVSSLDFSVVGNDIIVSRMGTLKSARSKGYQTALWNALTKKGKLISATSLTDDGERFIRGLSSKGFTVTEEKLPATGMPLFTVKKAAPTGVSGKVAGVAGAPDWQAAKESAMTKAREMHAMAYPTYDDANIIDETMRAIFPFWNYELFRWKWLPRTFMRTPGVMSGLARYMNYTDSGYVPVPGTDLQMNILRGTVFMGGLRSMYLKDFPEFHDTVPGIEFLDYIGRAGFFPGIHVMLPVVGLSSIASGMPIQWGELAPSWVKTALSGLRALSPQHIGAVLDIIYPDRFRDYMTMMELASMGYDGDEIWKKKQQNIKLTEEEEKLWLQAVAKVDGIKGVLMNQAGLFRIRPAEFANLRKEMRLAIEEATGVPVETQEWIDKMYPVTGKRFTDYYHLDIQQQALLYQWESFRRYQGITESLYPSSWQALDIKISDYYAEIERIYEDARYNGIYEDGKLVQQSMVEINRQLIEGIIGPDQWIAARSSMQESLASAVSALGNSPAYKDVPKTFDERAALLAERGITTSVQTPDQELLYYYYELEPELKYNWESERMELDFDTYYAYIDILLESLSPTHRERLLERIQNDWTPMEKLYWQFSRDFARPYRNLREVVLNQYTDEQRKLIRRYEVARGAERDELQEVVGPDGKLIAGYQSKLREARMRLRALDSTLDAWLYFFGTTDKFMSHEAEEIYNGLVKQYLVPAMAGG